MSEERRNIRSGGYESRRRKAGAGITANGALSDRRRQISGATGYARSGESRGTKNNSQETLSRSGAHRYYGKNTGKKDGQRPEAKKPSPARRVFGALKRAGKFMTDAVKSFNRFFDRFRTSDSKRIVTNVLLTGVIILLLISAFMLFQPAIDASRAVGKAEKGDATEAMQLLSKAQRDGLSESRLDKTRLKMADAFLSQGRYGLARQLVSEMEDREKANGQSLKINYAEAGELFAKGSFQSAAQIFYGLGGYRDSAEKYKDCLCAAAVNAYREGSQARARSLLAEMEDAEARLPRICAYLGCEELLSDALFSAENLRHMRESYDQLKQTQQATPKGFIAAGGRHSLVLRKNGTVLARGDNALGQCETDGWNDIVMVAAGNQHSVGLRANGTVVACGDNAQGQCNVGAWTDITAVAAGAFTTVGLKSDGSVVCCGYGKDSISAWQNIKSLSAGSYSVGALTQSGAMLSTHPASLLPIDVKMFDLAVSGQVSVGILYDGSLISSIKNAPNWVDLQSVEASETGIYAITLSGAVKAYSFRPADSLGINIASGAKEISASGSHVLILMSDDRVYAYGDNSYGQCLVNNLIR